MSEHFSYFGIIEAALELPEHRSTYLIQVRPYPVDGAEIRVHRMPVELFEFCARRTQPGEVVQVCGFSAGSTSYCSHFLPKVFHGETPEATGLDEALYHAEVERGSNSTD